MAVGFLCAHIKQPAIGDKRKLIRVLGYLDCTKNRVMILCPKGLFHLEVYIGVSFLTHVNGKLHGGVLGLVGGAPICFGLRKQKCIGTRMSLVLEAVGESS